MNEKTATKRGDSWPKLLRALGSSKPWVSRSLRPWTVQLTQKGVIIGWHGCRTILVKQEMFTNASAYILFGRLPAYMTFHVAQEDGSLHWCDQDDPNRVFTLSTTTINFAGSDLQVPTKLVIEVLRNIRQRRTESRGVLVDKKLRREFARDRQDDRKKYLRTRGDHRRWSNIAKFVRMVQEGEDRKEIEVDGSGDMGPGQVAL